MTKATTSTAGLNQLGTVVDPPRQHLLKVVWLSVRPWSVISTFSIGMLLVPSLDILTLKVLLLFLWFDFAFNLLNNGLNDIVDYDIDHTNGDEAKTYYKKLGGWGHAVHRTQFGQLLFLIALVNFPLYIFGFYNSPVFTLALLVTTILGNIWFNGLFGFPHANRNIWKTVSEYWIILGIWLWRAVVMDEFPTEQLPFLAAFLLIYHYGQLMLDYYDLDKDLKHEKITLVVKMGRDNTLKYLSGLKLAIAIAVFLLYPSYLLLVFNLIFIAFFWNKEDRKAGMLFTIEVLAIWFLSITDIIR